jgi:pimeloyl-ACP methyl ester carboxylesterase
MTWATIWATPGSLTVTATVCFACRVTTRVRRRAYAVSLRGHGNDVSFSDYIEDIRNFITKLGAPPVAVGHSLGGLIVQRLIDRVPLRGIVLMASAPPEGISMVGTGLMTTGLEACHDD